MGYARKIVELATNIAIILVCGLLCWTFFTHKGLNFGAPPGGAESAHLEGLTLPSLPGYSWTSRPKTLVLAVRKGCHYCEESLPFYKRLSDLERGNGLHAHLLAVMPDDQVSGTKVLQSGGLTIDSVFNQPLNSIQVSGTPTLLLLNSTGRVVRAWVGQQTSQGEEEVISASNASNSETRPWYRLW